MGLFDIFKRKEPSMEYFIDAVFNSEDFKGLVKLQVKELAKHRKLERNQAIKEKYAFFKHQLDNNQVIKAEQYDEWLYVKFLMEDFKDE